jgi:hypothetical protein
MPKAEARLSGDRKLIEPERQHHQNPVDEAGVEGASSARSGRTNEA